mmetsp:Transcript_71285/g.201219  ORF Transcript_71285/g.201219 Transcript_71285/m.201219 type:complete len:223 (+) Transcript_71285:693-1361(+)
MGVTNSIMKPGIWKSDGHQCCTRFSMRPLMCEPSKSWSAMTMIWPYRIPNVELYDFFGSIPMIFVMFAISALFIVWEKFASLTFSSFPRRGKTPYRSLPMMLRPATASDLALSPSVRMSVHSRPSRPPARFASSSFGMSNSRFLFPPPPPLPPFSVLPRSISSFALAHESTMSTMPVLSTLLIMASPISHLDPNFACFSVSVSLVCESNEGFSIWQFTKIHR